MVWPICALERIETFARRGVAPRRRSAFRIAVAFGGLLFAGEASAQPASAPAAEPGAEDIAELERALADDAKQKSAKTGTQTVTGVSDSPQSGVSSAVVRAFQSLNPNISFILDVAGAYFSSDDPLQVGGHDPVKNGFNLQALEMALSAAVDPYFRFNGNLTFSQYGVEIEEAYGTTLSLPWNLQVRAGQFLTRFGRINASHPHSWDFADQPLVNGKFLGGEGNRGLGFELSVLLPLPWYVELLGSATEAQGEATARSFFGPEDPGVDDVFDFVFVGALKQFFPLSDDWSLSWGLSAANGPNPTGRDNRTDIWGTDLYLKYRPISRGSYTIVALQLEWLLRRRQVPLDVLTDHGFYGYLLWRFARRWATAIRYEYVTGVSNDPLDPLWSELRQRVSTNVTFWPTEFSRVRLQYSYDHPSWREGIHALFLALEFAIGAHGAHRF